MSGEQRPRALGRVQARDGASAEQAAGETGPQTQQIPARPPLRPGADERLDEMPVRRGVGAEPLRGAVQRSREHDRVVVERVRRGHGRIDPLDVQIPERGRVPRERQDRGADVVPEAGKRQLGGAAAASDRLRGLVDGDMEAGLRKLDCTGKPVRARADDDRTFHLSAAAST